MSRNAWIVSDTHFGHKKIIEYGQRPFATVEEMDATMVERWNAVVKPEDRVYFLGDFCLGRRHLQQPLKGRVVLIKGNHDTWKLSDYMNAPWRLDDIRASQGRGGKDNPFLMTHIPIYQGVHALDRFRSNVHGHLHEKVVPEPGYVNVCVEHTNYAPIALEDVIARVRQSAGNLCTHGCP